VGFFRDIIWFINSSLRVRLGPFFPWRKPGPARPGPCRPLTETALLQVPLDILAAVDRRDLAALVLLDFCAAFDTVESTTGYRIPFERLRGSLGITGTAVILPVTPYTHPFHRGGSMSRSTVMGCGVPQGSVLGPDIVPAIHG
jgi:hypothetical protein